MYQQQIDTVGELIEALEDYDPQTPVRWAAQPAWPFEYTIGAVVQTPSDADLSTPMSAPDPTTRRWSGSARGRRWATWPGPPPARCNGAHADHQHTPNNAGKPSTSDQSVNGHHTATHVDPPATNRPRGPPPRG